MAKFLWGKVFFQDQFAGIIQQEPGERFSFSYDKTYLNANLPTISHSLPLRAEPYINEQNLPAFFDNLVAEGWLENAQKRLLGKRTANRFELLLAFGHDCAGAVSVIDPEKTTFHLEKIDQTDPANLAVYKNQASLSGIQPKFLLVKDKNQFRPAKHNEISTHIAKLPSETINDITYNEWITLCACKALLPEDNFVEAALQSVDNIAENVLVIKRFDRDTTGKKIHFEEFNQLLNKQTIEKYDGAYHDMSDFIYNTKDCIPTDVYRLFKRTVVGILTGNTDMHFKNFAMIYNADGLRLSPNYDQVAAAIYKPYQHIALAIDKATDRIIGTLQAKTIIALGREFKLRDDAIMMAINDIAKRLDTAKDAVNESCDEQTFIKNNIINFMEKRWNGTFSSIGKLLSKKR